MLQQGPAPMQLVSDVLRAGAKAGNPVSAPGHCLVSGCSSPQSQQISVMGLRRRRARVAQED